MSAIRNLLGRRGFLETTLTDDEAAAIIDRHAKKEFARSLSREYFLRESNGRHLTSEQQWWLHKCAIELREQEERSNRCATGFARIHELFQRAMQSGLVHPKISMPEHVRLSLPYERGIPAQRTDILSVRMGSRHVGVLNKGTLHFVKTEHVPDDDRLIIILKQFCRDPEKWGALWGIRSGICCFCSRELTTKESCSAGYGPICAKRWGLPWGQIDPAVALERLRAARTGLEKEIEHGK